MRVGSPEFYKGIVPIRLNDDQQEKYLSVPEVFFFLLIYCSFHAARQK